MTKDELEQELSEREQECHDLIARVMYLLHEHDLFDDNKTYTFPDNDVWKMHEDELKDTLYKSFLDGRRNKSG